MHTNMVLHTNSKKKLPEKKIHTGKIVMCLYMWSSELGHIYLLIQLDGSLFSRCSKLQHKTDAECRLNGRHQGRLSHCTRKKQGEGGAQ